jgi:hypothetical protein
MEIIAPVRIGYQQNVQEYVAQTERAREYASAVNTAIPEDCGVLQLPAIDFPEGAASWGTWTADDWGDYEHFWPSLTNTGKHWSYGAMKNTSSSAWQTQFPLVPTAEQLGLLRGAGFCAVHVDLDAFTEPLRVEVERRLKAMLGQPIAESRRDGWAMWSLPAGASAGPMDKWGADLQGLMSPPLILPERDRGVVADKGLDDRWWWLTEESAPFNLYPSRNASAVGVRMQAVAPACAPADLTLSLTRGPEIEKRTLHLAAGEARDVELRFGRGSGEPMRLVVDAEGGPCPVPGQAAQVRAQLKNLTAIE